MKTVYLYYAIIVATISIMITAPIGAQAEDLLVKNCSELLRMAQNLQEDLKTVDMVLGSAIEAGKMDSVKNYKMKKASVQQELQSVLKAIDMKSCLKSTQ